MPLYPFIILVLLFVFILTVPPFLLAYLDMKRSNRHRNANRKEEEHGKSNL